MTPTLAVRRHQRIVVFCAENGIHEQAAELTEIVAANWVHKYWNRDQRWRRNRHTPAVIKSANTDNFLRNMMWKLPADYLSDTDTMMKWCTIITNNKKNCRKEIMTQANHIWGKLWFENNHSVSKWNPWRKVKESIVLRELPAQILVMVSPRPSCTANQIRCDMCFHWPCSYGCSEMIWWTSVGSPAVGL